MNISFLSKKNVQKAFQQFKNEISDSFKLNFIDNIQSQQSVIEAADVLIIEAENPSTILSQIQSYHLEASIIICFNSSLNANHYIDYLDESILLINGYANPGIKYQAGLIGFFANRELTAQQNDQIETLFDTLGSILWLDDQIQFDGFCAVSQSYFSSHMQLLKTYTQITEKFGFTQEECYEILSLTDLSLNALLIENNEAPTNVNHIMAAQNFKIDPAANPLLFDSHAIENDIDKICQTMTDENFTQ